MVPEYSEVRTQVERILRLLGLKKVDLLQSGRLLRTLYRVLAVGRINSSQLKV